MTLVTRSLPVLVAVMATAGSAQAAEPLVTFHREYGGIVGGVADVRIERDGRTVAAGNGTGCEGTTRTFRLKRAQRHGLRADLRKARRKAFPRTRDQPSAEAPTAKIDSGNMHLLYRGFGVAPSAAQPLIDRLDRIARRGC